MEDGSVGRLQRRVKGIRHFTRAMCPARRGGGVIEVGDFGSGTGNAARKRIGWKLAAVKGASGLDVAAQLVEPGAELEGGAQEEFGAHGFEILLFESAFDAAKADGELLQLFFERGNVLLLELFELERFHDSNGAVIGRVGFPVKE